MSDLVGVVRELKDQNQNQHQTLPHDASTVSSHNIVTHSPASTHRGEMPKQPQFVGPTRSAFGILVSERSLNRMGVPKFDSMPPSGAQSPIEPALDSINDLSFWHCCTASDITKYLVNFQEEVESVYPFIDIAEYIAQSKEILQAIRGGGFEDEGKVSSKDIDIAKVAISTGILLEEPSKLELATAIVDSVQTNVSSILSPQVDLKEVQLLAMLVSCIPCYRERVLTIAEYILLPRRRGAISLALHRHSSTASSRNGSSSEEKSFG